jgi:hypothetical protein
MVARGSSVTNDPRNQAETLGSCDVGWARLDSNQGPTDYETDSASRADPQSPSRRRTNVQQIRNFSSPPFDTARTPSNPL